MNPSTFAPDSLHITTVSFKKMIFALSLSFVGVWSVFAATPSAPSPTGVLRKEHRLIEKMAGAAKQTAEAIRKGDEVDVARVEKLHDFFVNFADRCHHAKEEEELFPILRKTRLDPVVVDVLIKQHEEGRILLDGVKDKLKAVGENGTEEDRRALSRYLMEYAGLMDRHIDLENNYLWEQAASQLSEEEKTKISQAFRGIETEELGEGFHEKYHAVAMEVLNAGKRAQ